MGLGSDFDLRVVRGAHYLGHHSDVANSSPYERFLDHFVTFLMHRFDVCHP